MIRGYSPKDTAEGLVRTSHKTVHTDIYTFHPHLHEILSLAFTEFDLNILSKSQEALIVRYLENAEDIDQGICKDEELNQLDEYLGSLTNELYNKRK